MIGDKKEFGAYVLTSGTEYYRAELQDSPSHGGEELGGCCIPSRWTPLKLLAVKLYNDNTSIFTFRLPYENRRLDLPPGAALMVKVPGVEHGGGDAIRPYTSVSEDSRRGSFDILVKRYDEWGENPDNCKSGSANPYYVRNPNYKPAGVVSNFIHNLKLGDSLSFKYSEICFSKVSLELLGITMSDLVRDPNSIRRMSEDKKRKKKLLISVEKQESVPPLGSVTTESVDPGLNNAIQDSVFAHMMRLGTNPTALFNNTGVASSPREDDDMNHSDSNATESVAEGPRSEDRDDEGGGLEEEEDERSSSTDKATLDAGSSVYTQDEETKEEVPEGTSGSSMRIRVPGSSSSSVEEDRSMVPTPPSRPRPSSFRPAPGGGGASGSFSRSRSNSTSSSRGHTPPKPGDGRSPSVVPILGPTAGLQAEADGSSSSNNNVPVPSVAATVVPGSDAGVKKLTLLAVGVGVSPMIRILRAALDLSSKLEMVTFCYGVREVKDILMREVLEQLANSHSTRFKLVYCVGSRYSNMHFAAKKKDEYVPPPEPEGFASLDQFEANVCKKLGWIDEQTISTHAPGPTDDHKVVVCGLPGVYDKLCGSRFQADILAPDSILARLGFRVRNVIKL